MDRPRQTLQPLPYHCELRDYFKTHERELWDWFSSAQAQSNYTEALKLDLLKSTYRLEAQIHPDLYGAANEVKERLELTVPLTIYQSQESPRLNAMLYFVPGEIHVVLSGPLRSLLTPEEVKSVIGHELAHYVLWQQDAGEFFIVDRLVQAIACDPRADSSHVQSARWFRLYTEIYADRGSLLVTRDVNVVVSGLVKLLTGLQEVSAASYLRQAEEIFRKAKVKTEELSHPEAFIRARALALWAGDVDDAPAEIGGMIEGCAALDDLDLVGRIRLTELTRRLLKEFLRPSWFQTTAVLGHARMFFVDFTPARQPDRSLLDELKFADPKLREYLCFLLLDFVIADPELDQMPLAAALLLARRLEIEASFEKIVLKELKIRPRDLARVKAEAEQMLAGAEKSA